MGKMKMVANEKIDISDLRNKLNSTHPKQLLERIAEVKTRIAEAAAQQQQERPEKMERLNTQLGAENLKIAKETRRDNIIMLAIAKQGAQDSRTMRGIGWVTMAFLPATFVTSFFGMNFFEALENGANRPPFFKESGKNVWVFFSIAGPLTVISLVWFFLWDRKEAEKQEKILDGLLADIGDGNASGAQADDRKILVQKA